MSEFDNEVAAWDQPSSEITLGDLSLLCAKIVSIREEKERLQEELKEVQGRLDQVEHQVLNIMKDNAIPNFKGEFGTISVKNTKTITQPETLTDKLKLFEYLKKEGIFEEMVNVNSRTLSSWAAKEIEAKEKEGRFGWTPPGLKPARDFQTLSVRKK